VFQLGEADAGNEADHGQEADMTISDIAATLTGERMMTKYAGGHERPSRDEIARLAYYFYETRGRLDGR
jgi:hypothetical protein